VCHTIYAAPFGRGRAACSQDTHACKECMHAFLVGTTLPSPSRLDDMTFSKHLVEYYKWDGLDSFWGASSVQTKMPKLPTTKLHSQKSNCRSITSAVDRHTRVRRFVCSVAFDPCSQRMDCMEFQNSTLENSGLATKLI
jgi:hypothetical protein